MIVKVMRKENTCFYDCDMVNKTIGMVNGDVSKPTIELCLEKTGKEGYDVTVATVLVDDVNANVFLMNDNGQTIERLW